MHTSALCALHSVSAGQASFDGSQRRASVTQARVRPCHANVVHTSQVSRPDYPQREAIYFPGHLPSLSLSLREVVGGGWQAKFRITRHKLPRRFLRQNCDGPREGPKSHTADVQMHAGKRHLPIKMWSRGSASPGRGPDLSDFPVYFYILDRIRVNRLWASRSRCVARSF